MKIHGVVTDAGGGVVEVLVDRDTESYPEDGRRVVIAAEEEIKRLSTIVQRQRDHVASLVAGMSEDKQREYLREFDEALGKEGPGGT